MWAVPRHLHARRGLRNPWRHIDFRIYNDAFIEVEVELSGELTTGAVVDGEVPRWGKLVFLDDEIRCVHDTSK